MCFLFCPYSPSTSLRKNVGKTAVNFRFRAGRSSLVGWMERTAWGRAAKLRSGKIEVRESWWCHFYGEFYMFYGEFCCKFHDFDDIICLATKLMDIRPPDTIITWWINWYPEILGRIVFHVCPSHLLQVPFKGLFWIMHEPLSFHTLQRQCMEFLSICHSFPSKCGFQGLVDHSC